MSGTASLQDRLRTAAASGAVLDLEGEPDSELDAAWIGEIVMGGEAARTRRVWVRNASIAGVLDLQGLTVPCPLRFERCTFTDGVDLSEAVAPSLRFLSCSMPALVAEQVETRGDVSLTGAVVAEGLHVQGARIGGNLQLGGARLSTTAGPALNASFAHVEQNVFAGDDVGQPLVADGEVRLMGARVGGQVSFMGASLTNADGPSLAADGLHVEGDLVCASSEERRFEAEGSIRLVGAHVGGQVSFSGAKVSGNGAPAVWADSARVVQGLFFRTAGGHPFTASGELRMIGAHIGGLSMHGGELKGAGHAIRADRVRVDKNVQFWPDPEHVFCAEGTIAFAGARIEGQFGFMGGRVLAPELAVDLQEASISSAWLVFDEMPKGILHLGHARMTHVYDRAYGDPPRWPPTALEGCTYESLTSPSELDVRSRLAWLEADPQGYSPQPYEQLAALYRRAGRDDAARDVGIAKHKRRRATLGFRAKLWSYFLGATVAHGYRPSQALGWLLGLLVAGTALFSEVYSAGEERPGVDHDLTPARDAEQVAAFEPAIYTLDLLVPVISLGQRISWNADGSAQWVALALTVFGWLLTAALLGGIAARRQ